MDPPKMDNDVPSMNREPYFLRKEVGLLVEQIADPLSPNTIMDPAKTVGVPMKRIEKGKI